MEIRTVRASQMIVATRRILFYIYLYFFGFSYARLYVRVCVYRCSHFDDADLVHSTPHACPHTYMVCMYIDTQIVCVHVNTKAIQQQHRQT